MAKLGLICSAGGASMTLAHDLLTATKQCPDWVVLTDRECAAESEARRRDIPFKRIEFSGKDDFCARAAEWLFGEHGCDWTLLLFSRLVDERIFAQAPCVNIHPALLPAFPGLAALDAAQSARARVVGATAHFVDASIDGGRILAQVWAPMPREPSVVERLSFVQKSYLLLTVNEFAAGGDVSRLGERMWGRDIRSTPSANPALPNPALEDALRAFVDAEGIPWMI